MMLGLRVGHSKICYNGILIILNWSCFRSSEPKKKILTLFCLSEKQEINLSCEKCTPRDFPGCPVVKNPPSDAGDMGSIPARGTKIPCATWQLSVCATTREPACHNENPAQPKKKKNSAFPASESKTVLQWRQRITARKPPVTFFIYYPKPKLCLDSLQITDAKSKFLYPVNSSLIVSLTAHTTQYPKKKKTNQKMGRRTK